VVTTHTVCTVKKLEIRHVTKKHYDPFTDNLGPNKSNLWQITVNNRLESFKMPRMLMRPEMYEAEATRSRPRPRPRPEWINNKCTY